MTFGRKSDYKITLIAVSVEMVKKGLCIFSGFAIRVSFFQLRFWRINITTHSFEVLPTRYKSELVSSSWS